MSKEAVFTLKLEAELRDRFMAEAEAAHRPASQIVRDFMREFVERQQRARDHEAWFIDEVDKGIIEADDPDTVFVSNEEMIRESRERQAAYLGRLHAAE